MPNDVNQPTKAAARRGRPRSDRLHDAILHAAVDLLLEGGFRSVSMDAIAARAGVGRMTIYRRWPNKAAIVMDAFVRRVDPNTLFEAGADFAQTVRLQMRTMAKAFRGSDGALLRTLLAEAQFDRELATALHDRWTMPRRRMARAFFEDGVRRGELKPDLDVDAVIDVLYAPLYYRLQMGTGDVSDAYVDAIFDQAMHGLAL
jgi:AcrR family transcriptional regulator